MGLNLGKASYEFEYVDPWTGERTKESDSASETDFAFHVLGGAEMELSPTLKGMAELKYVLDGADYFGIWVGVLYLLGQ